MVPGTVSVSLVVSTLHCPREVLLTKSSSEKEGCWDLPETSLEDGETFCGAASRLLDSLTGLEDATLYGFYKVDVLPGLRVRATIAARTPQGKKTGERRGTMVKSGSVFGQGKSGLGLCLSKAYKCCLHGWDLCVLVLGSGSFHRSVLLENRCDRWQGIWHVRGTNP